MTRYRNLIIDLLNCKLKTTKTLTKALDNLQTLLKTIGAI